MCDFKMHDRVLIDFKPAEGVPGAYKGDGRFIKYLHGWDVTHPRWKQYGEYINQEIRCCVVYSRGNGYSVYPEWALTTPN